MIQHHGDSILRLAGVRDIASWQPLQAELVHSRRLPDGLIEVRLHGQSQLDLYVLEIATYPEARVVDQIVDDTALVYLAVTQFLARLRYNDPKLFQILGGRKAMIESPLVDELKAEWTRETMISNVIDVLIARFGSKAQALETDLKAIDDEARLQELVKHAATCRTLSSFRKQLSS